MKYFINAHFSRTINTHIYIKVIECHFLDGVLNSLYKMIKERGHIFRCTPLYLISYVIITYSASS